jgi:hypothetical protein
MLDESQKNIISRLTDMFLNHSNLQKRVLDDISQIAIAQQATENQQKFNFPLTSFVDLCAFAKDLESDVNFKNKMVQSSSRL